VRRLLRRRGLLVLLIWTAFIAVPVVQLWPAANTPSPPCNHQGAANQDPALPPCPPDEVNYEGIGVSLLILLWLAGVVIGLTAVGTSWLVRRRIHRAPIPPVPGPG
jgi:hypothetical protein